MTNPLKCSACGVIYNGTIFGNGCPRCRFFSTTLNSVEVPHEFHSTNDTVTTWIQDLINTAVDTSVERLRVDLEARIDELRSDVRYHSHD